METSFVCSLLSLALPIQSNSRITFYFFNMEKLKNKEFWLSIYDEQKERHRYQKSKIKAYNELIESGVIFEIGEQLASGNYKFDIPQKIKINKLNGLRKKDVYIFKFVDDFALKALNKILIEKYSNLISPACFSFQKGKGAKDAFRYILKDKKLNEKHCLKLDIHNFFNSINTLDFFESLPNEIAADSNILIYLHQILDNKQSIFEGKMINEEKGLMAGSALAPFLSNIYLRQLDDYFVSKNITYCRYSDDLIIFDTKTEINEHFAYIEQFLTEKGLIINRKKTQIFSPKEKWTFLGFSYQNSKIDISEASVDKLKLKIRRMSRRYFKHYRNSKFSYEQVLQYFIKRLNRKFYGKSTDNQTLCWAWWFFPLINQNQTLKQIDKYVQNRIRYSICGKYSKKNFKKVPYKQLVKNGYIPLIAAFYEFKNNYDKYLSKVLKANY